MSAFHFKTHINPFKMLVGPVFGGLQSVIKTVSANSEKGLRKGEDGESSSTGSSVIMRQVYHPQS